MKFFFFFNLFAAQRCKSCCTCIWNVNECKIGSILDWDVTIGSILCDSSSLQQLGNHIHVSSCSISTGISVWMADEMRKQPPKKEKTNHQPRDRYNAHSSVHICSVCTCRHLVYTLENVVKTSGLIMLIKIDLLFALSSSFHMWFILLFCCKEKATQHTDSYRLIVFRSILMWKDWKFFCVKND